MYSQSYNFPSSHVRVWELDHKDSWVIKNWCFRTVVLEKTLESPLNCKEIKSVSPKWNQYWIFIGRTNAEAEAQDSILNIQDLFPLGLISFRMLKLKFQYFGHLMQRASSWENTLLLGKTEWKRRREQQTVRWLYGIINSMDMYLSKTSGR